MIIPGTNVEYRDPTDGIAPIQLKTGDKAGAKESTLKALALLPEVDEKRRGFVALSVLHMLVQLDDLAGAKKAKALMPALVLKEGVIPANNIPAQSELNGKAMLAIVEVRTGHDDAAQAIVKSCPRSGDKAFLLHHIGLAQARAGRKEAAKATFDAALKCVEGDDKGLGITTNIVSAQAASGDIEGALRNAKKFPFRGSVWASIAGHQARRGDFDGARDSAAKLLVSDDSFMYHGLLKQIATEQAKAGQSTAVRDWAKQLNNDLPQAYVLLGLAQGLYREPAKK
jgi:tetratricopeptide (TPR) repeat protein